MTGTGRKKSSVALPVIKRGNTVERTRPNRNTIGIRSGKQMTKAEMYEDLRKAVENTK